MPGQAKIVSVMTAPVSTAPNCSPSRVTMGIKLLRNAWRRIARRHEAPRARAACTYCSRSSSSSVARRHSRQDGRQRRAKRDSRQHEVRPRAATRHRQPAELHREDQRQQRSQPEVRYRDPGKRHGHRRVIDERPPPDGSGDSKGNGKEHRDQSSPREPAPRSLASAGGVRARPADWSAANGPGLHARCPSGTRRIGPRSGWSRPRRARSSATSCGDAVSPSIACAGSPGIR